MPRKSDKQKSRDVSSGEFRQCVGDPENRVVASRAPDGTSDFAFPGGDGTIRRRIWPDSATSAHDGLIFDIIH